MTKSLALMTLSALLCAGTASALILTNQPPMSKDRLLGILAGHPEATDLSDVPALLPGEFQFNFVLKHGGKIDGPRAHKHEINESQSADPLAPRALLFDERNGFTITYNGGLATQLAANRLDMLSFDPASKQFTLEQIDFPIAAGHPLVTTSDCKNCHGPRSRPIFGMYPDWPSFYGSDNDELTAATAAQQDEFERYREFRASVAERKGPYQRYASLFDEARVMQHLHRKMYPSFPYRPDTATNVKNVSRAFAFRPALRLGILYNRLLAQHLSDYLIKHAAFDEYGEYFLFNLLECRWPKGSESAQRKWLDKVAPVLAQNAEALKADPLVGPWLRKTEKKKNGELYSKIDQPDVKPKTVAGGTLDYRQNLLLFGLLLNDVDIRFSYTHSGFRFDPKAKYGPMDPVYVGGYFNSYFDGSATIDELIAAALLQHLAQRTPALRGIGKIWGLTEKYSHHVERYALDKDFFSQMDALGKWIHIPYPDSLSKVHHREIFTKAFADSHAGVCAALEKQIR